MSKPKVRNNQRLAHLAHARELLAAGHLVEDVQEKLQARGLTAQETEEIICDLAVEAVYVEAVALLNQGLAPMKVKRLLTDRGLDAQMASAIVDDIMAQNPRPSWWPSVTGILVRLMAAVVFAAGVGLYIGNTSGDFRTFPFAGFIVMSIGALIWSSADWQ